MQSAQPKKNTAKEGSKKAQAPLVADADVDVANATTKFEEQLFKKLRNQKKKLREIEELEEKMKAKDFKPNDAQKEKVAGKVKVEAEHTETNQITALYLEQKRKQEKDKKRELDTSRKQAVRTITNVMCLSAILQKGHDIGEGPATAALGHFTECIDKVMNKDGGSYNWSQQQTQFTDQLNRLVLGFDQPVPGTEMSYMDLNEMLPTLLKDVPAEIHTVVKEPSEQEYVEQPAETAANDEAQEDEDEEEEVQPEKVVNDVVPNSDEDGGSPPMKQETAPVQDLEEEKQQEDPQPDGDAKPAGQQEEGEAQKDNNDRGGRGRGGKGFRERGNFRGRDGADGERGFRGGRNNRRRPQTAKPQGVDADDDDFTEVTDGKTNRGKFRGRGRGRGNYRGDRGEGGNRGYRGGDGERSGRGGRGRAERGERPFTRGGEKGQATTQNGNAENHAPQQAADKTQTGE